MKLEEAIVYLLASSGHGQAGLCSDYVPSRYLRQIRGPDSADDIRICQRPSTPSTSFTPSVPRGRGQGHFHQGIMADKADGADDSGRWHPVPAAVPMPAH